MSFFNNNLTPKTIVSVLSILFVLFAFIDNKESNICGDKKPCSATVSKDVGKYGNITSFLLLNETLKDIRFITVKNTSFFRVDYSDKIFSQWYYSPSFSKGHSTKIFYNFEVPTHHNFNYVQNNKNGIIIKINTVGRFSKCPEIILINSKKEEKTICVELRKSYLSFSTFILTLIVPTLLIIIILLKRQWSNSKNKILLHQFLPPWFQTKIVNDEIIKFKFAYDLRLIFYVLTGFVYMILNWQNVYKNFYKVNKLRDVIKNFALLYYIGYINFNDPKLVLSFVDNSQFLLRVGKICGNTKFIVVQNGFRSKLEIGKIFKDVAHCFNITNYHYLCISEGQKKLFIDELNLTDGKILIPFGSSLWKQHNFKEILPNYYDEKRVQVIRFVSQWHLFHYQKPSLLDQEKRDAQENLKEILCALQILYKKNYSIEIILRTTDQKEKLFFKKNIGQNIKFIEVSKDRTSSYKAAYSSDLLVAMSSTLALEAYLYGVNSILINPKGSDYFNSSSIVKSYYEKVNSKQIATIIINSMTKKNNNPNSLQDIDNRTLQKYLNTV